MLKTLVRTVPDRATSATSIGRAFSSSSISSSGAALRLRVSVFDPDFKTCSPRLFLTVVLHTTAGVRAVVEPQRNPDLTRDRVPMVLLRFTDSAVGFPPATLGPNEEREDEREVARSHCRSLLGVSSITTSVLLLLVDALPPGPDFWFSKFTVEVVAPPWDFLSLLAGDFVTGLRIPLKRLCILRCAPVKVVRACFGFDFCGGWLVSFSFGRGPSTPRHDAVPQWQICTFFCEKGLPGLSVGCLGA